MLMPSTPKNKGAAWAPFQILSARSAWLSALVKSGPEEVQVDNPAVNRVTLDSDNLSLDGLGLITVLDVQGYRFLVERVKLLSNENLVMIERDADCILPAAVYNGRNLVLTTLAAARTFPKVRANFCIKSISHLKNSQ